MAAVFGAAALEGLGAEAAAVGGAEAAAGGAGLAAGGNGLGSALKKLSPLQFGGGGVEGIGKAFDVINDAADVVLSAIPSTNPEG